MSLNTQRLASLRKIMQKHQLDYYLVPNGDPHNSEIPPACWSRRPWISQFTGSAGEALVGTQHAYLWTDGRYFLQAANEMDPDNFSLMKQHGFAAETEAWLKKNAGGKIVGVDPQTVSIKRAQYLKQSLKACNTQVKFIHENLIDKCKQEFNEPIVFPASKAFALTEDYTGETVTSKLGWLRAELKSAAADYIVLNVLDEIAWLFNLRAGDDEHTPVLIAYAIVGANQTLLFTDPAKLPAEVNNYLKHNAITVLPYQDFGISLQQLTGTIWLDDSYANMWMYENITRTPDVEVKFAPSPIILRKACKNVVEARRAREVHIRDAVAVISFFSWLENNWSQQTIDEMAASDKLTQLRMAQEHVIGLSFTTIPGFAGNGAVIHYHVTPETNRIIDDSSLFLLDSGSQYLGGTTDVTRTIHLGTPTAAQKRDYTLVLKGHLALGGAIFPKGTCGEHLDTLARAPLWQHFLNYRHGTGHGVGSGLSVHEGPQRISMANTQVPLTPGMIVSNEPGFYLEGQYGIRIENLCLVTEIGTPAARESEYGPFYGFETLTLIPYCRKLIDKSLLTAAEKSQLGEYYAKIRTTVMPHLDAKAKQWLEDELALKLD